MNSQMLMSYALSADVNTRYPAFSGEAWAKAAEVTILGMVMVFAVLAILWAVLALFKSIFAKNTSPSENKKAEPPVAAPVEEPVAVAEVSDDGELIAVITAAIAAYRATEEGLGGDEASGFRVVSFKRVGAGRPWNSGK